MSSVVNYGSIQNNDDVVIEIGTPVMKKRKSSCCNTATTRRKTANVYVALFFAGISGITICFGIYKIIKLDKSTEGKVYDISKMVGLAVFCALGTLVLYKENRQRRR